MPYTRDELLAAVRQDHPEFKNVDDNKLFAAIAVDHPELAKGISELQGGNPQGKATPLPWYAGYFNQDKQSPQDLASRTPGQVLEDQAANFTKGVPAAVTGIPSSLWDMAKFGVKAAMVGANPGMAADLGKDLATTATSAASPFGTAGKLLIEGVAPGVVNAPTPDAPETAQAAQAAGTVTGGAALAGAAAAPEVQNVAGKVAAPVANAFTQIKSKLAPYVTSPGLDATAINKWMDVPARQVVRGMNPGQQLLDENLLGATKQATKANVDAALQNAGQDIQARLQAGDAQGLKIDAEHIVKDALDSAQAKLKSPTDAAFDKRVQSTFDKVLDRYPDIDDLTPSRAHQLKVELGKNINWKLGTDDPLNDAFIQAYGDVNTAIKGAVKGIGPSQTRWGNLNLASQNLAESLADDVVGKGTGPAVPPAPLSPAAQAAKTAAKIAVPASSLAGVGYGLYKTLHPQP